MVDFGLMLTDGIMLQCSGAFLPDTCPKQLYFLSLSGHCAGLSRFSGNAFKIREAFHVVNQVQESYLRRGPQPPDTPDPSTVH